VQIRRVDVLSVVTEILKAQRMPVGSRLKAAQHRLVAARMQRSYTSGSHQVFNASVVTKFTSGSELAVNSPELWLQMSFEQSVRAALLYFDMFDFPLTENELYFFLPLKMTRSEFDSQIRHSEVRKSGGYYLLRETDQIIQLRQSREKKAKRMLAASHLVGKTLRHFPFLRGAFLSGSLSKGVDSGDADIDLFIVSAEDRLWICRSALIGFKKLFLLNSKKYLCPNYFLTEKHLKIPEKNIFTATEIITLRPLYNNLLLAEFLKANEWISAFFPNYELTDSGEPAGISPVQRISERILADEYLERMDKRLMEYFRKVWKQRYPGFDDARREFLFRTTPHSSKIHPNDFQTRVLTGYEKRLEENHLWRLTRLDD